MTIYIPGTHTGAFGGYPGELNDSAKNITDTILKSLEKRRQDRQGKERAWAFQEGPKDPNEFVKYIMSNPNLDPASQKMVIDAFGKQSQMNLESAQAEHYRTPKAEARKELEYWKPDGTPGGKMLVPESRYNETVDKLVNAGFTVNKVEPEQSKEIEYWKPDGTPGGKLVVKESRYNDAVKKIQDAGYVVNKPGKEESGEFERLLEKLDKSKKVTPEKKNELINQRIQKLVETGKDGDETNKITLGDGQRVTLAELRAQYREKYNIPDEFDLQMMGLNPDPQVRQQAARLKAEAATKPSFVDFMNDAKKKGLEGLRPEGKTPKPGATPPLPPGFKLD